MKNIRTLDLYYLPTCPYCAKVREYIKDHNIQNVSEHDVTNGHELKDLVAATGKEQVPCLFINGEPLLESDAIIEFLSQLTEDEEADRAI